MKLLKMAAVLVLLLLMVGCGARKTLHCDHCGNDVIVSASSNMEEDWIIYCETCNEELYGDDPVVEEGDLPPAFTDEDE